MIDIGIGAFTAMLLLTAMLVYLWFTRDDPGGRDLPGCIWYRDEGSYPYPPLLTDFPGPGSDSDGDGLTAWSSPSFEGLATTGELRRLAYAGDIEAIDSEAAAFLALLRLDEWTAK